MTRSAPPAAWLIACLLISPLLYAVAELAVTAHGSTWSADAEVSRRIDEFFATPVPAGTRRGVMLGISGGLCAFAGDPADGDVRVLPIAAVGQGFHELYPYLDQVIAGRPAFILIQGTALVTTGNPPTPYQVARLRLRQRLLAPLLRVDGEKVEGAVAGATRDTCRVHALARDAWAGELDEDIGWVTLERGGQARQRLLSELDRLIASAIPLYVFEQPRNEVSVEYMKTVEREVEALLGHLGDHRHAMTMLNYQEVMPTAMFFDAVHLRPEGAAPFRARLLDDVIASITARTAVR